MNNFIDVTNMNYDAYQWISLVNQTPNFKTHNGTILQNPIVDGAFDDAGVNQNYPFYDLPDDQSEDLIVDDGHKYFEFQDNPYTFFKNNTFSAETTLVGFSGNQIVPILTFTWGYQVINGETLPFTMREDMGNPPLPPSQAMQDIINAYNKKTP